MHTQHNAERNTRKSKHHERLKTIKAPQDYGAFNQKPLTIKPYPMKIRNEYMHHYDLKDHPGDFLIWNNSVSTKQITIYPHRID